MASNESKIVSVLMRNGTDQLDRTDQFLQPESVKLQGFELEQWMQFAYEFAGKVNYFSPQSDTTPSDHWKAFFASGNDLKELLKKIESKNGDLTPHLTLFVCFLKLMELSTKRLNNLTKRHLDFYYREILQLQSLPAKEDKAFVLFELAKNASEYLVKSGTELDSGKDAIGKKRIYELTEELPATKTIVAQIKNVYNEHLIKNEAGLEDEDRYYIKAAPVANSIDGIGGALTPESPTWYPFGYYSHTTLDLADTAQEELPGLPELPDAKLGFAVASPVMRLAEGKRIVTVQFSFLDDIVNSIDASDFVDAIEVYFTGVKGWIGPHTLSLDVIDKPTAVTKIVGKDLFLTVLLDEDVLAITDYVAAVHGEQFSTNAPVARFLVKTNADTRYNVYSTFAGKNNLQSVTVTVDVEGAKNLVLESDTGTLNAKKPFFPFTTQPVKGSSFSVFNEEVSQKKWSNLSFQLKWKSTPLDFRLHYSIYDLSFIAGLTKEKFELMFADYDPTTWDQQYFDLFQSFGLTSVSSQLQSSVNRTKAATNKTIYKPIVANDAYFEVESEVFYKEKWFSRKANLKLFKRETDSSLTSKFEFTDANYERGQTGPIRIRLEQSFLHEMFPTLYAIALSSQDKGMPIPNEPYTPFAEDILLNYKASDTVELALNDETEFEERTAQLFHEHPFGQSEEHAYLKSTFKENTTNCAVLPTYCKGGELYIGLQNAQVSELVALLFQVAEGTENPLAKSFINGQKVQWEILCNNVWRSLDSSLMVQNEIDNFLLSGRIKFTIPPYANSDNTLLPSGLFWIRAKMFKRYDAVCRVVGVHAQVAEAEFNNRGNDLAHLATGIPAGSIAKLVERLSQIKKIQQPYPSFGGKPEESDQLYYRRVSERLRHKNRAITLWDYEHLVLQEFPQIYKAKCLNHTSEDDYISPGNVTIVVIPDTVNKTVFDIYQPRVSRATLNKIQSYLSELNSMHVSLSVINPNYEEIMVELGAKFYAGLDDNTYKKQLEQDIIHYLSPWAFEKAREITFGVMLYRSSLIHYIEKLDYVDYIEDVRIFKDGVLQSRNCAPSNPKSILVSAKEHKVKLAVNKCQQETSFETEESCQL